VLGRDIAGQSIFANSAERHYGKAADETPPLPRGCLRTNEGYRSTRPRRQVS
jgi:hypothetical protein